MLAALAVIADLALERFGNVDLPAINGGRAATRFVLACVAAGFVALKFLFHIHFDLFGFGFWAADESKQLIASAARPREPSADSPRSRESMGSSCPPPSLHILLRPRATIAGWRAYWWWTTSLPCGGRSERALRLDRL